MVVNPHISWWMLSATGLLVLAAGLILTAVPAGRLRSLCWRGGRSAFGVALWLLPVVILLTLLMSRQGPQFQKQISIQEENTATVVAGGVAPLSQDLMKPVSQPSNRLQVHQVVTAPPEWLPSVAGENVQGVVQIVSSQRFATLEEAEQQITTEIVARVRADFESVHSTAGSWLVPLEPIAARGLIQFVGESFEQDFGEGVRGTMYRAHARLQLTPELRAELYPAWRQQVVTRRVLLLAAVVGAFTLVLGVASVLYRANQRTAGQHLWRFRLAAAAVLTSGSLQIGHFIR